jgi:uncharacterized alpha-E superfamily protein
VLSRIADSVYWMSRHLERAGDTARLIEINLLYLLEAEDALPVSSQWKPLLSITASEEAYAQCYEGGAISAHKVIQFMTQERKNPNAIRTSLRLARENARVVRDRISKEMWEAMNELWLQVDRHLVTPLVPERATTLYAMVRNGVARFHGLTMNTMMRGEGWGFYLLGTRILDVKYHLLLPDPALVGSALDYYQWAALLKSLSGFEAYRRKYHAGLRPIDVAEFLIFEPDFPRSLRFCVTRMHDSLRTIASGELSGVTEAAIRKLEACLEHRTADQVFRDGLHEYLEDFLEKISQLHAALAAEYFEAQLTDRQCAT